MPGLPDIEVPTVTPAIGPSAMFPVPSPHAFLGGAVGAGLTEVGEKLHAIGAAEYQRGVETKAQEAETAFQKGALKIRDDYRNKYNWDAVSSHTGASEALENLRKEIGQTIGSKSGLSLYDNNTLRNARFVQESMDAHFEQQHRAYQESSYRDVQAINTNMLAGMATGPGFNPDSVAEKAEEIYSTAKQHGLSNGLKEDEASLHAQNAMHTAMDAYFDVLSDKHSGRTPDQVKSEFEKWNARGFLDKHVVQKVGAATYANVARGAVREIFDTTPRLVNDPRFDGSPDPDGEPDFAGIQAKVGAYIREHPEQEEIALHEYTALKTQQDTAYTQQVKQRVDRVVAKTREDMNRPGPWNGVFHVDPTSRDYLWLLRNKATALDPIIRSEYTTDQRLQKERHDSNETAFKADLIRMASEDPAAFEKLTPADLFKMEGDKKYVGGFNARFQLEGGDKVLKELKEQHQKNELAWIEKTTVGYLKSNVYTNKDEEVKARSGTLHNEIAIALQEKLKAGTVKRDDWKSVNDFMQAETAKVGQTTIFGGKFGGEYKAEQDARQRAAQPVQATTASPVKAAPQAVSAPHKILTIKREGKDMKWDATDKKWVE